MNAQAWILGLAAVAAAAVLLWPRRRGPWSVPPARGEGTPVSGAMPPDLVPEGFDLMALALQGGGAVETAARDVGAVLPSPFGDQLRQVADALAAGEPPETAWAAAGPHWAAAGQSLTLASRAGVAPGEALARTAADLRRDAVADVEAAAARLGVTLVLPLGLAFLPAFVLTTIVPVVVALMKELTW